MDKFLPRVITRLVTRFIFHLVDINQQKQTSVEQKLRRLRQVLLKIQATIEEAEVRQITNQHMLLQLKMLLDAMYQGCFTLDKFQCENAKEERSNEVQQIFTYSLSNPAKRMRMIADHAKVSVFGDSDINSLQGILDNIETIVPDLHEFNTFLGCYPRRERQPYSAYLYLENCMFGRHVEKEQIINFLLQPISPYRNTKLDILPVIGKPFVGKRTLMENVCNDERVKNYFYFILNMNGNDLECEGLSTERLSSVERNQNLKSRISLVVIELDTNVDMDTWKRFCIRASNYMAEGSKIIIISAMEEATKLGTVSCLRLNRISEEAYWYFFKLLAFGSTNAEEHPRLVSIAMEIAKMFKRNMIGANAFTPELRANVNFQFWSHALITASGLTKRNCIFLQKYPTSPWRKNIADNISVIIFCSSPDCGVMRKSKSHDIREKHMELTVHDILNSGYTKIPPNGKFDVRWKSPLPPYDDCVTKGMRKNLSCWMSIKRNMCSV